MPSKKGFNGKPVQDRRGPATVSGYNPCVTTVLHEGNGKGRRRIIHKPGDLPGSPHNIVFEEKTGEGVQELFPDRQITGRGFFLDFLSKKEGS